MTKLKNKKKIGAELKYGGSILSIYLLWAISWLIYSYFIKGELQTPYFPKLDITLELLAPFEKQFILGTDIFGRSLFEVLSAGLLYSISMSLAVSFLCASIGITFGYFSVVGSKSIRIMTDLFTNLVFVFPSILIAIMVMSITGQSFMGLVFALVLTGWPGYSKIARGETRRVLGLSYVESAKAVGMGNIRLFFRVIFPAILPFMLVHFVLGISGVIISEAALGFLGLGGSAYSWGAMLSSAKTVLLEAPHVVILLSLTMSFLIIGLNLFGDGLRDYLDPHS